MPILNLTRFLTLGLASTLVIGALAVVPAAHASSSKKKTQKNEPLPVTSEELQIKAREELAPAIVPRSEASPTPSVMLPLHDAYVPTKTRTWSWTAALGLSQHKIPTERPENVLGVEDLRDLGPLPFLRFSMGFEKDFSNFQWGASLTAATTLKNQDLQTPTGLSIPANLQWFSTGFEPQLAYKFGKRWGLRSGVEMQWVTVAQTSTQSDFARWSKSFLSTNPRVGVDAEVGTNGRVNFSVVQRNSPESRDLAWDLSYGVKW